MHSFNGLKLDGLEEASRGVNNLVGALNDLSKVGNVSKRTFAQFGKLGETLKTSFSGLGTSLKGLEEVSNGVNNMAKALETLSKISGSAKGSISQLGNLGESMHKFEGISGDIEKLIDPIKRLMEAIGNLGNNNNISIRVDQNGLAKVGQIQKVTKKAMSSWDSFINTLQSDKSNLNLGDLFDLDKPVDELEKNLSRAQRSLSSFENNARANMDKVNSALSNFSMHDLKDNLSFRTAYRSSQMSDAYAKAYRSGIESLKGEIESIKSQNIDDAWNHTMQSITENLEQFNLGDLINTDLPLDQMRANLRRMQNELSRAQSAMQRAQANMQRLQAQEPDQNKLRADEGYRGSYYTYQTNIEYVNRYRQAIEALNAEISSRESLPQTDVEGLRALPQLTQQLDRYRQVYNELLGQDNLTDSQQRNLSVIEDAMSIISGRIDTIRNQLEVIPSTEEGVLETMRQIADEAERTAKATEETTQNLRDAVGKGFGSFGNMLSGSKNQVVSSIGNLTSLFGKSVQDGTAKFDTSELEGLQSIANTLGTVVKGVGQFTAVANVVISVFRSLYGIANKATQAILAFKQSVLDFAKTMLSKVVGAFNAVAGAVGKVVSSVRSGSQAITVALRKIGEVGKTIISIFGRIGTVLAPAVRGVKALMSAVTPRFAKTLLTANGSLKDIVKNTKLLSKAIQVAHKWFSMLTKMLMRKIVQAFISGVKQAFDDLVLYEKNAEDQALQFNNSVSRIFSGLRRVANQIIAIFEPLINALATPLENFLDRLSFVGEQLAKFMAILTGQPYYIKAKKFYEDYGQNVEDTNKKVKNLTNGLDELNILNDSSSSDDSQIKPKDMFEKVPVGALDLPSVKDILDQIKDWLRNIDWDAIKKKVRDFIHRLMEIINEVLRDVELWGLIGDTLAELFNTLMEAWNQFITDFDPVATEKALSELIVRALNGIDWDLVHENVELTAQKFAQFWNEVFADDTLWDAITTAITNFLNEVVHYFDTWAWTFDFGGMARQLTRSLTNILEGFDYEQLRHAVEGWAKGIVDFINTTASDKKFWATLGESIAKVINATIIEALGDLAEIDFTELTDSLKLAIEKALNDINWEDFEKSLKTWGSNLADIINGIFADEEFLSSITTSIAKFSNAITGGLAQFIEDLKGYDIGTAISNSLQKGLGEVDWTTAFTLPADALNKLSDAINGFVSSLPQGFVLSDWLSKHLIEGLDRIDWNKIIVNLDNIGTKLSEFVNGLTSNRALWEKAGSAIGNLGNALLAIPMRLTWDIKYEDLGSRIADAINKALKTFNIQRALRSIGKALQNIVDAVSGFVISFDWDGVGKAIGKGIADAVKEIDPLKLRLTIYNALSGIGKTLGNILNEMLANGTFANLGKIIGNFIVGLLSGMANLLGKNKDKITSAMKQFANALAKVISDNEDVIVDALNTIIDAISSIVMEFFNSKSTIFGSIFGVIERLNLGQVLGTIIFTAIRKAIAKFKMTSAMMKGLLSSLGSLFSAIFSAIKPYILPLLLSAIGGLLASLGLGALGGKLGGLAGGAIGSLFGPVGTAIGTALGSAVGKGLGKVLGGGLGATGGFALGDWISGLFSGKNAKAQKAKIDVQPEFEVQEASMPSFDNLFADASVTVPTTFEGTMAYDTIDANSISGNKLKTGDIIGGTLRVSGISGLDDALGNALGDSSSALSDSLNLDDILSDGYDSGMFTGLGVLDGIKDTFPEAQATGEELFTTIDDAYRKKAEIHSPSQVMYEEGQNTGEGLYNGIEEWIEPLKELMRSLVDELLDALEDLTDKVDEIGDKLENGFGGKSMLDGIEDVTDKLDDLLDKLLDIKKEIKDLPSLVEKKMKKVAENFKRYINQMKDVFDKFKEDVEKFFEDLPEKVQDALDEAYKEFEEWADNLEELFDKIKKSFLDFVDTIKNTDLSELNDWNDIFDGVAEASDEELADTEDVLNEYLDKYKQAIDDFNEYVKEHIWEGLKELTDEKFSEIYDTVVSWLDKIKEEFGKLKLSFEEALKALKDVADSEMSQVYDVIQAWLEKIQALFASMHFANVFSGLADAIKGELDKAYAVVDEWVNKVNARLQEVFGNLNNLIQGALNNVNVNVNCSANCNANCCCCSNSKNGGGNGGSGSSGGTSGGSGSATGGGTRSGSGSGSGNDDENRRYTDNGVPLRDDIDLGGSGTSPTNNDRNTTKGGTNSTGGNGSATGSGTRNGSGGNSASDDDRQYTENGVPLRSDTSDTPAKSQKPDSGTDSSKGSYDLPTVNEALQEGLENGRVEDNGEKPEVLSANRDISNVSDITGSSKDEDEPTSTKEPKDTTEKEKQEKEKQEKDTKEDTSESPEDESEEDSEEKDKSDKEGKVVANVDTGQRVRLDENGDVSEVLYQADGTWGGKYYRNGELVSDNVEQYRKDLNEKAKKLYEEITSNANATSSQKSDAKRFYNGVNSASTATYADGQYKLLEELAKKVKEQKTDDLIEKQGIRIGMEGANKVYYNPNSKNASYTASSNIKAQLASAIFKDKDTKGQKAYWYLGTSNVTTPATDSALIQKMKDKIKTLYGITENDLPDKYKNTNTQTENKTATTQNASGSAGQVSEESKKAIDNRSDPKNENDLVQAFLPYYTDENGKKQATYLTYGANTRKNATQDEKTKRAYENGYQIGSFSAGGKQLKDPKASFDYWYKNSFLVKGYQMGGLPQSGELYLARENGANEFIGSLGSQSVVANNDQIVTAVANGVAMANDSLRNAIENQTQRLESAIDRKDLDVQIGDRQIAEANRRGTQSMGNKFVE